ncbi:MAG: toxin [Gammaproteobacteria bacterium]|nr:MAG: toxin [Gammaproteobacteria bacterium]
MNSFEFDHNKSLSNLDKHGIDFIDAQSIWQDPDFIEITAKSTGEPRSLVIGMVNGRYWSAVTTYREPNIRFISVRRSRNAEVAIYES